MTVRVVMSYALVFTVCVVIGHVSHPVVSSGVFVVFNACYIHSTRTGWRGFAVVITSLTIIISCFCLTNLFYDAFVSKAIYLVVTSIGFFPWRGDAPIFFAVIVWASSILLLVFMTSVIARFLGQSSLRI
jgi:hypothetical protein